MGGINISGSDILLSGNDFIGNDTWQRGGGIICGEGDELIYNNVLYSNSIGIGGITGSSGVMMGPKTVFMNNIVVHNDVLGGTNAQNLYNTLFNANYVGGEPGVGAIFEDPLFLAADSDCDPYNYNYRLQYGTPCINAGNPDLAFNDKDSSRNDMGVYGGPYAL